MFPRQPQGLLKRHIADEADARLAFYLPIPSDPALPPGVEIPPRPQLPEGVVDAPLVRVFNFLRRCTSFIYIWEISDMWYTYRNDVYVISTGNFVVPGKQPF